MGGGQQASSIATGVQAMFSWGAMAQSENANYNEMNFNKVVAENNATLADNAAADAITRGQANEQIINMKGAQTEGSQKVAIASSGVDLQSGTAMDLLAGTAAITAYDAKTAQANAGREAWDWKNKAQQIRKQSELDERKAGSKATATFLGEVMKQGDYFKSMMGSMGS